MAENLKVNSRTDILEFKRKHNLLVDAVPTKDTDGNYKIFENIVDSQGHKRFIENDFKQDTITGVTTIYGKWSLSGTHIMFVFAGKIDNATALSSGRLGYFLDIPDWVLAKIYPVVTNVLEVKNIQAYSDNYGSAQTISLSLRKVNDKMELHCSSFTATADRYFRAQFDLLIDNEEPVEETQGE